jgi:magnesium-transporting ATPase (P-type)
MGPHPTFSKLKRFALRQKEVTTDTRSVHCGAPERNLKKGFAKNAIHTTKYNFLSFLPKGLFEQFRRVANIYFLFHAGLSLTPITPVNPVTTIVPLVFVIGVAMVKEGIEDLKRGRSDKKVNGTLVDVVLGPGKVEARRWKDVRVGDIVRVTRDSSFPGDLVFLGSSDPEGVGFVETMNLDGETNLKVRNAVEQTRGLYPEGFGGFDGTVECEQPNPSLYTFAGTLNWRGEGIPLGPENILLRGSDLRNTAEVYGAVIFTGHDTKIMMNATSPPSKRSFIERRLDYVILGQMALLFLMSLLTAIWFGVRLSNEMQEQW